ncbi:MAG: hypothetical protein GX097_03995 [Methanomicrobiales archaeon]|nr:hypothetical protein [Methanomicrobiales archaeon]
MTGTQGHFKKGVWVEEPMVEKPIPADEAEKAAPEVNETEKATPDVDVEKIIATARNSVSRTITDVTTLGKTLFGTKEGHEHLENEAKKAGESLEKAINDAIDDAKKILKKI